jgi:hypothetical protein
MGDPKSEASPLEGGDRSFLDWCLTVRPGDNGPSAHVVHLDYHCQDLCGVLFSDNTYISHFTNLRILRVVYGAVLRRVNERSSTEFGHLGSIVRSLEPG